MMHAEHWDEHTRQVVTARLYRDNPYRYLTTLEAESLRSWCSLLLDDERAEIIQFVLGHIDKTLSDGRGEGQRGTGVPPAGKLIRDGLKAVDATCQSLHTKRFFELDAEMQKTLMTDISGDQAEPASIWSAIPQKDLFKKLLQLSVEAYYSHPTIWSEIGYAGPAYPRGYITANPGQRDAWEAKLGDET
ncbi:gluconate 2-dehydrogenase subunit 3 family protein [Paenibacillus thalictri]|uniref:Gluconate 2-dehydrogenase subunit 3 family protein n=2 Tax=Paenibacillus thalictri TaxID=2527873 RepID=A0A4Q9DEC7_9BACL|nr:gluconate 2-dehydrogenase subunit 3 family protein [Paenibacillus thalictri]